MIPYSRQSISQDEINEVIEVLNSDFLTQGSKVEKFENELKKISDGKYAIAVNSATSALHLACLSLGLKKGDIVWTVPNTFVASANCALYCQAKVDFVDIDKDTLNMSVPDLYKKLVIAQKSGSLPKILIPVHYSGYPCDMKKIFDLSKKFNFKIIEDASHALGAKYDDLSSVGSCRYSDITVFSFHPVKIITTAEGGAAITNDKEIAKQISLLRTHGITRDIRLMTKPKENPWYYEQIALGFNYRLSDVHAAIGLAQIRKLDLFRELRLEIVKRYDEKLSKFKELILPNLDERKRSSWHLYPVILRSKKNYEQIFDRLRSIGIGVNLHYLPVHMHPYYRQLGFKKGDFPISENFAERVMTIPVYPSLNIHDQERVINAFKLIFGKA